jgi:RimJ/RimL family protein N-acetyltransferase
MLALADGTRLRLRPLGSDDRDGVAALFARLSPESRYRRFLSPKRELTPRELARLTDIDHLHHEAFAAIDQRDDSIVGVGRYVHIADRPGVADLAVEVTDELQNMGIGTALARHTVQRARDNGFALLTATTLSENRPARALLRRLKFRTHARHGSQIELELKLDPPSDRPERTDANPIVRALPIPTAHPSPEAWPDAPAGTSSATARPGARSSALCRTSAEHTLSTAARMKAARVPLSRDQESTADSGAPGNDCIPRSSLATGDELRSMAFSQPHKAPAAVERSGPQLTRLVYELLDAHADTEHLSRTQHSELLWRAHLCYLRDLQRVAREVLADVS